MPSSWSSSLRFELQFTGENINLWGDKLNVDFQHIDYAIAGWLTKTVTGDFALTTANATDDEARAAMVKLSGSPAANFAVTIPAVSKSYTIWNNTAKVATITTGAGATVTIDATDVVKVISDGAAVWTLGFGGYSLKDYITSFVASAGAVPSPIGNAGKFLNSDGASVTWQQIQSADIGDFDAEVRRKVLVYTLIFGGA